MTITLTVTLLLISAILLLLAAVRVPSPERLDWGWFGMFFFVVHFIVGR